MGRVPRVVLKVGCGNLPGVPGAKLAQRFDIAAEVMRTEMFEVPQSELEQPFGGVEPPSVHPMAWPLELLLQMHERSGDLDETLEIILVSVPAFQPEGFEHLVGLEIFLPVKTLKKVRVTRIEFQVRRWHGLGRGVEDVFDFFHARNFLV